MDRLAQAPADSAIGLSHYMHGAVCRVKPEATAFELRQSGAIDMWISRSWQDAAAAVPAMRWTDETVRLLQPFSGGRLYANYQTDDGEHAAKAVFGGNHPRLAAIKHKYDSTNFFRRNSNIRPAAG